MSSSILDMGDSVRHRLSIGLCRDAVVLRILGENFPVLGLVVKLASVTCLSFGGVSILHWRLRSDGTTHGSAQSSDFGGVAILHCRLRSDGTMHGSAHSEDASLSAK